MREIATRIRSGLATLAESQAFKSWVKDQKLSEGSIVAINNSFVFRDQLKTTKNPCFLCLCVDAKGKLTPDAVKVASDIQFNTDFKHFSPKSGNLPTVEDLDIAVGRELETLGMLVHVLIGSIEDNVRISQPLNHALFDEIVLDPVLKETLRVDGRSVVIHDVVDEEALWTELGTKAKAAKLVHGELPEDLVKPFAIAVDKLTSHAYAVLTLPKASSRDTKNTLLNSMATVLNEHVGEYRKSLAKCNGEPQKDPDAFNNLLRIAYNFATDAPKVIRLLISICDLKGLIFWLTLVEWFRLSEHFRNLPWSKSKKKPSLGTYRDMIAGARNRAFHNIFPFTKTLRVQLKGVPIGAKSLTLFSEHSRKSENVFDFEDKALVEILMEFTRAGERAVSPLFWRRNLDVMAATVALLSATSSSLKLLARHSLRPSRRRRQSRR